MQWYFPFYIVSLSLYCPIQWNLVPPLGLQGTLYIHVLMINKLTYLTELVLFILPVRRASIVTIGNIVTYIHSLTEQLLAT